MRFGPSVPARRKQPFLQGPIDDAFMDRFLMVRPTGQALNEKVGDWTTKEMAHAIDHWRRQFRGEALQKNDVDVTDADVASSNLVLWGDPGSNKILARILELGKLPMKWNADKIQFAGKEFAGDHHSIAMIFPNPLNPKKYVVLNSGFTFREFDYLNNARQIPKLPDFAVLDVSIPADSKRPAGIVSAGFFNERWEVGGSRGTHDFVMPSLRDGNRGLSGLDPGLRPGLCYTVPSGRKPGAKRR